MQAKTIGFLNEKGGSCKTTLTVHTGAHLAREQGLKVLLVDLDPQGQVGKSLGLDVADLEDTVLDWLTRDDLPIDALVLPTEIEGLDVAPANKTLVDFPLIVSDASDRYVRLLKAIRKLSDYDVVICDAPPSLGIHTVNILMAVESVVVPVNCTYLALDGCAEIVESVGRVRDQMGNEGLKIEAVVPTLYRRTRLADEIVARLERQFGDRVCSVLRYDVKVDEAQSHGRTVFDFAPRSRGAAMLAAIAAEVWKRVI
ncbi:MAG: chromosome partitioning protein [Gemmatimonadetes bacterium]|nr:chromosome partitioning protein [Gemmatimonadota bacterium]